jgi:hypothetical protein
MSLARKTPPNFNSKREAPLQSTSHSRKSPLAMIRPRENQKELADSSTRCRHLKWRSVSSLQYRASTRVVCTRISQEGTSPLKQNINNSEHISYLSRRLQANAVLCLSFPEIEFPEFCSCGTMYQGEGAACMLPILMRLGRCQLHCIFTMSFGKLESVPACCREKNNSHLIIKRQLQIWVFYAIRRKEIIPVQHNLQNGFDYLGTV